MNDILNQLQADVYGVLCATPALSLARIILDDKEDLESSIENLLANCDDSSGKAGLAIIVLAVEVESAEENLPGPPLAARVDVQCLEYIELNRSRDGTMMRSSQAALRVLQALHHHTLGTHTLYPAKPPIKPLPMRAGYAAHMISLRTMIGPQPAEKPGPVTVETTEDGIFVNGVGLPLELIGFYTKSAGVNGTVWTRGEYFFMRDDEHNFAWAFYGPDQPGGSGI